MGITCEWEHIGKVGRVRMGSSGGEAEAEAWERRESPKRWNRKGEGDGQASSWCLALRPLTVARICGKVAQSAPNCRALGNDVSDT